MDHLLSVWSLEICNYRQQILKFSVLLSYLSIQMNQITQKVNDFVAFCVTDKIASHMIWNMITDSGDVTVHLD